MTTIFRCTFSRVIDVRARGPRACSPALERDLGARPACRWAVADGLGVARAVLAGAHDHVVGALPSRTCETFVPANATSIDFGQFARRDPEAGQRGAIENDAELRDFDLLLHRTSTRRRPLHPVADLLGRASAAG